MWHAVFGDANPYVVLGSLALVLVIYAALSYQFNKDPTKFLDFALRYRWIAVLFIVLPASKLMHTYTLVRNYILDNYLSAPHLHDKRVLEIQRRVREWQASNREGGQLCTARPQWIRVAMRIGRYQNKKNSIPINLNDILGVDFKRSVVRVEPGVNMGQLTRYLNPKGWTVPVVPELDELTVGGLICGYGIEGSSHKYGLFADTVVAYEILVASGEVLRCTKEENTDLFYAIPWSYGSLGFLMAVELEVIPCKPYMRVQYFPTDSAKEIADLFRAKTNSKVPPEFAEAIMYTKDEGVVITADFADTDEIEKSGREINNIGLWFKKWFYTWVREACRSEGVTIDNPYVEYIPLREFYHRHTQSIFWEGELIIPFGNQAWFRWLLGWMMPLHVGLLKLTQGRTLEKYYEDRHVCQDALVSMDLLEEGIQFFHKNWECYPLWMAAHKTFKTTPQGMMKPTKDDLRDGEHEMFVDLGAWYAPGPVLRGEPYNGYQATKNFEHWLIANKGYQCLYAVTEMTREEYTTMFNMENYHACRKKYGAEGVFMDVYDKVRKR